MKYNSSQLSVLSIISLLFLRQLGSINQFTMCIIEKNFRQKIASVITVFFIKVIVLVYMQYSNSNNNANKINLFRQYMSNYKM